MTMTTLKSEGNLVLINTGGGVLVRNVVTGWTSADLHHKEVAAIEAGEIALSDVELHEATISLRDYLDGVEHPVLYWSGIGRPMPKGEALLLAHGLEADDYLPGLLDLEGIVSADGAGAWKWNGEGDVRDDRNNTVQSVQVHDEPKTFAAQLEDYLSEA